MFSSPDDVLSVVIGVPELPVKGGDNSTSPNLDMKGFLFEEGRMGGLPQGFRPPGAKK